MTILRVILILIIGFLLVFLSLQNYNVTTMVKVFHRQYNNISLSVVMLYAFGFGLLTIGIFAVIDEIRLRTRLHKQKKEKDALYEELKVLRNWAIGFDAVESKKKSEKNFKKVGIADLEKENKSTQERIRGAEEGK